MDHRSYRRDIDGLRALAVIPVVLFHAGATIFMGGFAGVDVFFVISGFLITGVLFKELRENGRISIPRFYGRRIARIFPAMLLVVAATLLAGVLLLSTALYEVHSLAKSTVASVAFVANIYFLVVTDNYFAPDTAGLPLLHMWSLAVEEQYYLVWPLLMIAALRIPDRFASLRNRCLAIVIVISAASLLSCIAVNATHPAAAFYLPFTRAWELGLGSALALLRPCRVAKLWRSVAGVVGIALILIGYVVIRESGSFPFPLALFPTIGTCLLIWAGEDARTPLARLLALPPFVSVGRVSYAWYLWHWPLLAFANVVSVGEPSPWVRVGCVVASLLLSYPTVSLVENPIRFGFARRNSALRTVVAGLAAGLALIGVASGVYAAARFGLLDTDPMIAAALTDVPPQTGACLHMEGEYAKPIPAPGCLAKAGSARILLWGDSYANQWRPSVEQWRRNHKGWSVEQRTVANCPPVLGITPNAQRNHHKPYVECIAMNAAAAQDLTQPGALPTTVILAANWLAREGSDPPDGLPPRTVTFDMAATTVPASLAALSRGLENTLSTLDRVGIRSIVVLQSPRFVRPPAACVQRLGASACAMRRRDFDAVAQRVDTVVRQTVARHPLSAVLDPADFLCSATICPVVTDNRIAYSDVAHVTASTARSPNTMRAWAPALDRLTRRP